MAKNWAVPKLLVPLGHDVEGRPVSVTCWGRAVPKESLYDDDFPKTFDLDFLYKVGRAVAAMHAVPELRRVEPKFNDDIFATPAAASPTAATL